MCWFVFSNLLCRSRTGHCGSAVRRDWQEAHQLTFFAVCRRLGLSIVGALACVLAASAASQAKSMEYVVFSIKGSFGDLALGQVLLEGERIELPDGIEVQLLSKLGEIVLLRGPFLASVTNEKESAKGEAAISKIAGLLFRDKKFVGVLGGTRTVGDETDIGSLFLNREKPKPWSPLLSDSGDYCLDQNKPVLRRSSSAKDIQLVLNADNQRRVSTIWKAGSGELDLSRYFAPSQTDLHIALPDQRTIVIHVAEPQGTTVTEQIAWMAEKDCNVQALGLLARD